MFLARIYVTLKPTVNDPQGRTVKGGLKSLGFTSVDDVRVGKYLEVRLQDRDQTTAESTVKQMCAQLLANPVIEEYRYEVGWVEELSSSSPGSPSSAAAERKSGSG